MEFNKIETIKEFTSNEFFGIDLVGLSLLISCEKLESSVTAKYYSNAVSRDPGSRGSLESYSSF